MGNYLRLNIENTHKLVLEKIRNFLKDGTIISRKRGECKQIYCYTLYSKKAIKVLKKCLPYLIIKKPEAEYVIKNGSYVSELHKENLSRLKQYEYQYDSFMQLELKKDLQMELL